MDTMSEVANQPVGQTIEGRYRIVRKIAEGGMATVYEAMDDRLSRPVAIKIMHIQLAQGPHRAQFQERFRREARSAASIANPHVVQVYDTGEFQGLDYLVMEYVHGVNLRREMSQEGTFTVRETLRVVGEILDGLAAAHRLGVVHRDIKPENILINSRGHVQITDFGLAKAASQATLSSTGMLLGTAAYLAPEMIEDNRATPQGDLYSVGIIAWEMLAGRVPFESDNPVTVVFKHVHEDVPALTAVCPGISPLVSDFVARLTGRAVESRPDNAMVAVSLLAELNMHLGRDQLMFRAAERPEASFAQGAPLPLAGTGPVPPTPPTPLMPPEPPAQRKADAAKQGSAPAQTTTPATGEATAVQAAGEATTVLPEINEADAMAATRVMPPVDQGATQRIDRDGNAFSAPTPAVGGTTSFIEMLREDFDEQSAGATAMSASPSASASSSSAPTQAIGRVPAGPTPSTLPATEVHAAAGDAAKPKKRHHRGLIAAIAAVVLAGAAAGGGYAWWYYLGPGSYWTLPAAGDVQCATESSCTISGANAQDYIGTLNVAGIPYTQAEEFSDDVPAGAIVSANPSAVGSRISKRSDQRVSIVVSKGVRQATVPADIKDPNSASGKDPVAALKEAGFDEAAIEHDESKDEYSLTVPEGAILTISAEPGKAYNHNEKITVTLSKGLKPVQMPNIVGQSQDDAKKALADLNLTANVTEAFDDKVEAGKVVSASVDAGATLKWGDKVDVVVSKGPQMVTVPNVVGQQYDDAAKTLKDLGFNVQQSAPLGDWTHIVRMQSVNAGDTVRVRDENGTPTTITLTVA